MVATGTQDKPKKFLSIEVSNGIGLKLLKEPSRKKSCMYLMFKEDLPENCPEFDSLDQPLEDVWRFLRQHQATEDCFASHTAKGRNRPENKCACQWSSCSLFVGKKLTAEMLKTPMFKRFKARARLSIPPGSGRSKVHGSHVDFWAYDTFSFTGAVVKVLPK